MSKYILYIAFWMGLMSPVWADDFIGEWAFSIDRPDLPTLRDTLKLEKTRLNPLNPLFLFGEIFEKLKADERTEDLCRDRVIDALLNEDALRKRIWTIIDKQHEIKTAIKEVAAGRGAAAMRNFNIDHYIQDIDPELVDKILKTHQEILLSYLEARHAYGKMGHLDREKVLAVKAKLTGAILLPFPTCQKAPREVGNSQ